MTWNYPAIADATAELLLVTHEHGDHNAVQVVNGVKQTVRSAAGTFDTPAGRVIGIASEHDPVAGTQRGANVIYVFEMVGVRVCHMGDFGQAELRTEQRAAIGDIDLLFVPVGGRATIDGPCRRRAGRAGRAFMGGPDALPDPGDFLPRHR
jgi:L-ascorbate metabolism protein UlaG (beta-lactamase superfamily)